MGENIIGSWERSWISRSVNNCGVGIGDDHDLPQLSEAADTARFLQTWVLLLHPITACYVS